MGPLQIQYPGPCQKEKKENEKQPLNQILL
jgi:hypothetical protein